MMWNKAALIEFIQGFALRYYGEAPASVLCLGHLAAQAWDHFAAQWLGDDPAPIFFEAAESVIALHAKRYGHNYPD